MARIIAWCDARLFESERQFNAGCGWPSFDAPVAESAVGASRYVAWHDSYRGGVSELRRAFGACVSLMGRHRLRACVIVSTVLR